ncbi:hypothetical protein [Sulfitobacter sp. JB4-11]|uniref:hypothetical protein n=1 Tax=Sulfitobacter rhodophyticola TaxID=3238304 RepID=UPI003519837B
MRGALLLALVGALSACGGPPPQPGDRVHPRHGPIIPEPGVTISGDLRVGVVGSF